MENNNLEGVRQNLVIMMADIRDFTSMSEKLVPGKPGLVIKSVFWLHGRNNS